MGGSNGGDLMYRVHKVQAKSLLDRMSTPVLLSRCLGICDVPFS
jgi:hypothetical protein